tara:strand:- start:25 stop:462 length:438 start_codon:yes stop_codon:yes gene_type:complete
MNLKELKSMIKEELESYMHEDDDMNVDVDAGMDDVAVDGGEMDMEAGGGAEDTLKAIYDQLASYFEGGEVEDEMDELPGEEGGEEDMDMGDEESMEEGEMKGMKDDMDEAKKGKDDKDKAKKKKGDDEEKALKERFQKLANIIKG